MTGATAGAAGNVAGHFVGDVYDQVLDGKQGFDSLGAYGRSAGEGAVLGGVVGAGVGLAAAKFLPPGARTVAQEAAVAHPGMTRLLEAARSAGRLGSVRVQMTVRELRDALGGGRWPPGFRPAFAGAGGALPPRVAAAPPGATIWVSVRPLADLNAPIQMQGKGGGDLVEIESVELGEEIQGMFDELGGAGRTESYLHPEGESFASESSRLGESGPELDAISARDTNRKAGVVKEPEQVATDLHHVFPKQARYRAWFRERGIDVDDYCIELTPPEHQAQHGGGDWRLARQVAKEFPEAQWTEGIMDRLLKRELRKQRATGDPYATLTPEEIIDEGKSFMKVRRLGELPFRRYQR